MNDKGLHILDFQPGPIVPDKVRQIFGLASPHPPHQVFRKGVFPFFRVVGSVVVNLHHITVEFGKLRRSNGQGFAQDFLDGIIIASQHFTGSDNGTKRDNNQCDGESSGQTAAQNRFHTSPLSKPH